MIGFGYSEKQKGEGKAKHKMLTMYKCSDHRAPAVAAGGHHHQGWEGAQDRAGRQLAYQVSVKKECVLNSSQSLITTYLKLTKKKFA